MKLNPLLLLIIASLALGGCSSTPTKVDTGPIHGHTFSFVSRNGKPSPGYADTREAIHPMIQDAITKTLTARGLARTEKGGDLTVAYLVIVGDNVSTEMVEDYFGYGGDAMALGEKAHKAYTGNSSQNYFSAGTLLIDLIDAKTSRVLKRGYTTGPTMRQLPNDARAARIQEAVDKILQDVRVAP